MAQHEVQAKRGLFSYIRKLIGTDDAVIVDLLRYDNPPASYTPNDLITYETAANLATGYTPPDPLIVDIPAGTTLNLGNAEGFNYDPDIYGTYPSIQIYQTSNGGNIAPKTFGWIDRELINANTIAVYLPNDGNGVTLDAYRIIIKP